MEKYGFKTELPADTMSLSEYKNFKAELYNTTTIADLNTIKNNYSYAKDIIPKPLKDLLDDKKSVGSINFNIDTYLSMIYKDTYVKKEGTEILLRAQLIFKKHVTGLIQNQLYTLLISPPNAHYNAKLKVPLTNVTKLLLFAHGDYSSMHSKDLSDLISEIKRKLIALGLSSTILVYTYDINDLILPDFSSKEALASFTTKFGKFDCIVPINCFNPKSFYYGEVAKKKWKHFVETEFVNVINTNVTPDGYIITVGAKIDGEYATFLNFYKDTYHIVEEDDTNTLHIIDLKNKLQTEKVIPKKKNSSEEKAKQAAEQAKREAEEKAKREAEEKAKLDADQEKAKRDAEQEKAKRDAEEKAKREAEQAKRDAEEKAKREAEEKANRKAEEKAKRDAEEKAKRDAENKAKRDAEQENAKQDAKYTSPKKSYTGIEDSKINFINYA